MQKIDELKKKKQELKSFEDKNETKKRYILEKLQIIEKTRIDNQYKNNEVKNQNNLYF